VRLGRAPVGPLYEIHDHDEPASGASEALPGCGRDLELSTATRTAAGWLPGWAGSAAGRDLPWRIGALVQVLPACLVAMAVGFILVRELVSQRSVGAGDRSSPVRSGKEKRDGDASRVTAPRPRHPPGAAGPQLADERSAKAAVAQSRFPAATSVQRRSTAGRRRRRWRGTTHAAQEVPLAAAGSTEEAPLAPARAAQEGSLAVAGSTEEAALAPARAAPEGPLAVARST
jgi:hypothetical protein